MQTVLEKWIEVRKMACKREDRFRHNTIAFWLSDEEKSEVEAKIILSGVPKGEYYRKSVLEQEIKVVSGNYMSFRLSKVLERICEELHNRNSENEQLLLALLFRQRRGKRLQYRAHVLQRFRLRGFLLWALYWQPGDLHAFDF